jgi:hypothetical protein
MDHLQWPPQQAKSRTFLDLVAEVVTMALTEYATRIASAVDAKAVVRVWYLRAD